MKYFFIFLFYLLPFFNTASQNKILISGKTNSFEDGSMVYISAKYPFNTFYSYPPIEDSSIIKGGKFNLALKGIGNEFFSIVVKKKNSNKVTSEIFLGTSPATILLKDSLLQHIDITGNKVANEYIYFNDEIRKLKLPPLYSQLWKKYNSVRNTDTDSALEISGRIDSIMQLFNKKEAIVSEHWIDDHPQSLINSFIIYYYLKSFLSDDSLKIRLNRLSAEAKKNSWGRELNYIINNTITGAKAPAIAQKNTDNNMILLSDFIKKGKYVLLDFWASWCGPCRESNPDLRKIYQNYKNRSFEILGISLDKDKKLWTGAIKKDSLPWPQVSDLNYWKNKAAQDYYIRSIPSNFLLNPQGEIIARDLSIAELNKKLMVLLK